MTAGDIIRKRRMAKGWSQLELAARCGVPNGHIASYENGRLKTPNVRTAIRLARAFHTTVEKMFGDLA